MSTTFIMKCHNEIIMKYHNKKSEYKFIMTCHSEDGSAIFNINGSKIPK